LLANDLPVNPFDFRVRFRSGLLGKAHPPASSRHAQPPVDVSGNGMAIDLLIGGTPTPGLAFGGGLIGNWSFGAEYEREGLDIPSRDYQDGTLGVFVDGFPSDTGGWHIGGLVGQ
jgi:hypothetical protein